MKPVSMLKLIYSFLTLEYLHAYIWMQCRWIHGCMYIWMRSGGGWYSFMFKLPLFISQDTQGLALSFICTVKTHPQACIPAYLE